VEPGTASLSDAPSSFGAAPNPAATAAILSAVGIVGLGPAAPAGTAALNSGAGLVNVPTLLQPGFADTTVPVIRAEAGLSCAEPAAGNDLVGAVVARSDVEYGHVAEPSISSPLGNDLISKLSFLDRASIESSVTQFLAELGAESSPLAFEPTQSHAWLIAASAVVTIEVVRRWRSRQASAEFRSARFTHRVRPALEGLS
jgi:hypothetical protein